RRHDTEIALALLDSDHVADRLDDLASRKLRERHLHGVDQRLPVQQPANIGFSKEFHGPFPNQGPSPPGVSGASSRRRLQPMAASPLGARAPMRAPAASEKRMVSADTADIKQEAKATMYVCGLKRTSGRRPLDVSV